MADDEPDEIFPSSSPRRPFNIPDGFPFVFLPSAFAEGFPFVNNQSHATADDQPAAESRQKRTVDENSEEIKKDDDEQEEEEEEEEEIGRASENGDGIDQKNDLRISQPKYSQLLKELDFSHTRMVDVTELLLNNLDSPANYLSPDENENLNKTSGDEKYQSLSSAQASVSSDEPDDQLTDANATKKDVNFTEAANEIQNDLNNLAAMIQGVSLISTDDQDNEKSARDDDDDDKTEPSRKPVPRRAMFDEDDDTSKQATQNYDLHDFEQEDPVPSSKSSRIPRPISQHSSRNQRDETPSTPSVKLNTPSQQRESTIKQKRDDQPQSSQEPPMSWDALLNGTHDTNQPKLEPIVSESIVESHSTPKKTSHPHLVLSAQVHVEPLAKPQIHYQFRQISSSSSDTESIVEHELYRTNQGGDPSSQPQPSASIPSQTGLPSMIPMQTMRQDSQGTLIDENLDDLTSQLKQGLFDQERQTLNTSTKEERTTDGIGSMSFPLSTPDKLSTDIHQNDLYNGGYERVFQRATYQPSATYNDRATTRDTFHTQQHSSPPRKKTHHRHHRHATSRHVERDHETNSRKADDDWLNMLEKLEREHRTRLEKQQQQYETYMHTLEEKMQRRFDEYLTLTSGFQESRLDTHDDPLRFQRTHHTSIPIDSNIGKYKPHSHSSAQRPVVKDLISQYYPPDSTLNIISTGKKRAPATNAVPRSHSRDAPTSARTEQPARHGKHIADLKSHYEYEINELKSQLNRSKMGQTSSSTRQSMEAIERMNNENIHLHDEVNELRHSLQMTQDENVLLKRQLEELREQITSKDLELKSYHRTIADLEQQLTEAENTKERQDERCRHAERQALLSRDDNEKIKTDLNLARDRLLRLEERYREQESENETLRRQLFIMEKDRSHSKPRAPEEVKLSSTMASNIPTSREYGRFTLPNPRHSATTLNTSRDAILEPERYQPNGNGNDTSFRHAHSPRPLTRISDYLNEKPLFPPPYVPPSRPSYSPRKTSPSRRRAEQSMTRNSVERPPAKQSEQLEQKFDQLLKKKRDLEARLSRIPTRNPTTTDRQLYDVLEREIERVEQQAASVKLELRKINVLRAH